MHRRSFKKRDPRPEDLDDILTNLRYIANKVQTDPVYCKNMYKQLKKCRYNWSGDEIDFHDKVLKLFAVAVNDAIQKKVNLSLVKTKKEENNLLSLLNKGKGTKGRGTKGMESLSVYFSPRKNHSVLSYFEEAKSPLDMAVCLKENAPQWLVENIIQYQYDIRWNTFSGKPDNCTFYQFCEKTNSTDFLKYTPRLAHVKATLYKKRTAKDKFLGEFSKDKLCPKVFVKTLNGWQCLHGKDEDFDPCDVNDDLPWINESIMKFINENADTQRDDQDSLKRSLEKPTLYWAVLDDTDFQISEKLKLKEISRTQVYVGEAINGILGRWIKDGKNHCEMMKKCLENVYAMTTYDPLRLDGIQLVDARLALAKVRRERSALFVMKTFGDDVEKAEIQTLSLFAELPFPRQNFLPGETQESIAQKHSEELEKCEDKLAAAKAKLKKSSKPTRLKAQAELTDAEKLHKKGKKLDKNNYNIIPYEDYDITWKPTDMAYGMNSR